MRTGRDLVVGGRTALSVYPALGLDDGRGVAVGAAGDGGRAVRADEAARGAGAAAAAAEPPGDDRATGAQRAGIRSQNRRARRQELGVRRTCGASSYSGDDHGCAGPDSAATRPGRQRGDSGGTQGIPAQFVEGRRDVVPQRTAKELEGGTRARRQAVQDVALGDVRIENGTVRYTDVRGGILEEVRAINARVSAKSLSSPVEAKGDLALRGDKVEFDGRVGSPRALMEERSSRVALAITSPKAAGRFDGSLSVAKGPQADGTIKLETRSLRALAGWIGAPVQPGPGLGPLSLEGEVKSSATWVALNNAKIQLDAISATGNVTVDMIGGRPSVKGNLRLGARRSQSVSGGARRGEGRRRGRCAGNYRPGQSRWPCGQRQSGRAGQGLHAALRLERHADRSEGAGPARCGRSAVGGKSDLSGDQGRGDAGGPRAQKPCAQDDDRRGAPLWRRRARSRHDRADRSDGGGLGQPDARRGDGAAAAQGRERVRLDRRQGPDPAGGRRQRRASAADHGKPVGQGRIRVHGRRHHRLQCAADDPRHPTRPDRRLQPDCRPSAPTSARPAPRSRSATAWRKPRISGR